MAKKHKDVPVEQASGNVATIEPLNERQAHKLLNREGTPEEQSVLMFSIKPNYVVVVKATKINYEYDNGRRIPVVQRDADVIAFDEKHRAEVPRSVFESLQKSGRYDKWWGGVEFFPASMIAEWLDDPKMNKAAEGFIGNMADWSKKAGLLKTDGHGNLLASEYLKFVRSIEKELDKRGLSKIGRMQAWIKDEQPEATDQRKARIAQFAEKAGITIEQATKFMESMLAEKQG